MDSHSWIIHQVLLFHLFFFFPCPFLKVKETTFFHTKHRNRNARLAVSAFLVTGTLLSWTNRVTDLEAGGGVGGSAGCGLWRFGTEVEGRKRNSSEAEPHPVSALFSWWFGNLWDDGFCLGPLSFQSPTPNMPWYPWCRGITRHPKCALWFQPVFPRRAMHRHQRRLSVRTLPRGLHRKWDRLFRRRWGEQSSQTGGLLGIAYSLRLMGREARWITEELTWVDLQAT